MPDVINLSCRFRFDKIGGKWSLDSLSRQMNRVSGVGDSPAYVHLRQQVHIVEEPLETLFDVLPIDFLFILNMSSSAIVTYGRLGETHLFKLKPGEVSFIKPTQFSNNIGIKATIDDTKVDFITLEKLEL